MMPVMLILIAQAQPLPAALETVSLRVAQLENA